MTNKLKDQVSELEAQIQKLSDGDNNAILAAEQKYAEHSKTKEAGTIYDNYGRRKAVLDNQHGKLLRELISLQASYKEGEYGTGEEVVFAYAKEYRTLSNHNLIEYEEKLKNAGDISAGIISDAKKEAEARSKNILDEANAKADNILNSARENAETAKIKAVSEAKEQIADLAAEMARKLVTTSKDSNFDSGEYDRFIRETGDDNDGN